MIETPQVVSTEPRRTAKVHITVSREGIAQVMGPGLAEIHAALADQGVAPAGPWCTHHLRIDDKGFDFEIHVPVAAPVTPAGRVQPGEWPTTKVVRTVYYGGYEGLPGAWGEFDGWIAAHGHRGARDLWECYTVGPESTPDPAGWRTELNRPLAAGD